MEKVTTRRLVLRPIKGRDGMVIKIKKQLMDKKINPKSFGVIDNKEFEDGGLLLVFKDPSKIKTFINEINIQNIHYSKTDDEMINRYEARIHSIPTDVSHEEICEAIIEETGIQPLGATLHPYHDQNRFKDLRFAVVKCTLELFKKLQQLRTLGINWHRVRIDTNPLPIRCGTCKAIGHTKNRCEASNIPPEILHPAPEENIECIDCHVQNHLNKNNQRYNLRNVNHARNSIQCPTLKTFIKRRIRNYHDAESVGISQVN